MCAPVSDETYSAGRVAARLLLDGKLALSSWASQRFRSSEVVRALLMASSTSVAVYSAVFLSAVTRRTLVGQWISTLAFLVFAMRARLLSLPIISLVEKFDVPVCTYHQLAGA